MNPNIPNFQQHYIIGSITCRDYDFRLCIYSSVARKSTLFLSSTLEERLALSIIQDGLIFGLPKSITQVVIFYLLMIYTR